MSTDRRSQEIRRLREIIHRLLYDTKLRNSALSNKEWTIVTEATEAIAVKPKVRR